MSAHVTPYVGEGAEGCRASAQIDREEAQTLDRFDPRRDELYASAERWEERAQVLDAVRRAVEEIMADEPNIGELPETPVVGPLTLCCPWCHTGITPTSNLDDPDPVHARRNPLVCSECGGFGGYEDWAEMT